MPARGGHPPSVHCLAWSGSGTSPAIRHGSAAVPSPQSVIRIGPISGRAEAGRTGLLAVAAPSVLGRPPDPRRAPAVVAGSLCCWGSARRSDDTDARKATVRRFGRSDRRAQRQPWVLRSILPKRALSLALARTIASSAAVGIAQGGRVKCAPGIRPTRGGVMVRRLPRPDDGGRAEALRASELLTEASAGHGVAGADRSGDPAGNSPTTRS